VTHDEAMMRVHDAMAGLLDEGELVSQWVLTMDVVGPDDTRYLAHRAGGGGDGLDRPTAWTALGMLEASAQLARDQLRMHTTDTQDEDDER
jgi:hypothetical protein